MTLAKPYTTVEGWPTSTHFIKDWPEGRTCVYIQQNGMEGLNLLQSRYLQQ
jgi:hypothetical protein